MEKTSPPIGRILLTEVGCALGASLAVAPFITVIDKSIFANASGREPLLNGLINGFKILGLHPIQFIKQPAFLAVWGVYSTTYCVANVVESLCVYEWNRSWFYPKFIAASTTNVTLSVLKDMYFTKAFGAHGNGSKGNSSSGSTTSSSTRYSTGIGHSIPRRRVPFTSNALYMMRDTTTIFSSFNLPSIVSHKIYTGFQVDHHTADIIAQLITPCTVQFMTSPLQLLGMDLYNRPTGEKNIITYKMRWEFIKKEYLGTSLARVSRIFPAYGIGGVLNKYLREVGKEGLVPPKSDSILVQVEHSIEKKE